MSFAPYRLAESASADENVSSFLSTQLRQHNNLVSAHHRDVRTHPPEPLNLLLYDDAGEIRGGLTASTYWAWLEIDTLWLHETLRGHGYGHRLLALAEQRSQERGCRRAFLTTYSFQARGFYEKAGYVVVGALEDYPPGAIYYWMRKDF